MKKLILPLALICCFFGAALSTANAQSGGCNDIAIGQEEYVIITEGGEVMLLPIDGDIGVRISSEGFAEQFRFRPGEGQGSVRADVEIVGGEVLRGHICTGCIFYPGESVPTEIMSNQLLFEMGGLVYQVPLHLLMAIDAKGGGVWELAFRFGEKASGKLSLPQGVEGLSVTTDFGLVNLPLDKIASVTIMSQGE